MCEAGPAPAAPRYDESPSARNTVKIRYSVIQGLDHFGNLGNQAVTVHRNMQWLKRRLNKRSFLQDLTPSKLEDQAGFLLGRYHAYCEQLGLVPNSGVLRLIQDGKLFLVNDISLANFGLYDPGLLPVAWVITLHPGLASLNASNNGLSDGAVLLLLRCLDCHGSLRALSLAGNVQVSNRSLKPLLNFIRDRPLVGEVNLERTAMGMLERDVLHLQACKNSHASSSEDPDLPPLETSIPWAPCLSRRSVEELVKRFDFLGDDQGPQLHGLPEADASAPRAGVEAAEDDWSEMTADYHKSRTLHRRWYDECSRIAELERRNEETAARELRKKLQKTNAARWGLLARLLLQEKSGLKAEQELALMVKRALPTTSYHIDFEIKQLQRLLGELEGECSGDQSFLHSRARARFETLTKKLELKMRHTNLLRSVVRTTANMANLRRELCEKKLRELMEVNTAAMPRLEMQKLSKDLVALVERGENVGVDEQLLAAAEAYMEEVLEQVATRQRVMGRAVRIIAAVAKASRFTTNIMREVQERALLVESGIDKILGECGGWERQLTLGDVTQALENLQALLDAAHIRHSDQGINKETLERAERLAEDMANYLQRIQDRDERVEEFGFKVKAILSKATFSNEADGIVSLQEALREIKIIEHFVVEDSKDTPQAPGDNHLQSLSQWKEKLVDAVDTMERGAKWFGFDKRDLKEVITVGEAAALKKCLLRLEECRASAAIDDDSGHPIVLLQMVWQRLRLYGYKDITQLNTDEKAEVTKDAFCSRMAKVNIIDNVAIGHMYDLLTPFSFANFRRLLNHPYVTAGLQA